MVRFTCKKPDMLMWDILSFLALDASAQSALIGPTAPWFLDENPHKNPGANYLVGVLLVYVLYNNSLYSTLEDVATVEELENLAKSMLDDPRSPAWHQDALAHHADWQRTRALAQQILSQGDLWLKPPDKPFWFPDIMEVENYQLWEDSMGNNEKAMRGRERRIRRASRRRNHQ